MASLVLGKDSRTARPRLSPDLHRHIIPVTDQAASAGLDLRLRRSQRERITFAAMSVTVQPEFSASIIKHGPGLPYCVAPGMEISGEPVKGVT